MLTHANGRWSTACDRCKTPVDVVGEPDRGRQVVQLEATGRFLESFGWQRLYRKNAGYRVDWWCPACVAEVKGTGAKSLGHSSAAFDMKPAEKKPA